MSSSRTGTIATGGCNGTLSAVASSAKSTEKVTNKAGPPVEGGDGNESRERSRTLKTSDFAAADLDLDVADEQLLAADGVLTLGKCSSSRTVITLPPLVAQLAHTAREIASLHAADSEMVSENV